MTDSSAEHAADLVQTLTEFREEIARFTYTPQLVSMGTVIDVGESIVHVSGLRQVMVGEILRFENGTLGMALNLTVDSVGAIIMGPNEGIVRGGNVQALGYVASVPVGEQLLGRVVDALGRPVDGKGPISSARVRPVEYAAPGIIERAPVNQPLITGIKAVDALVPIGRGQRQLIIGDRQTGKTTMAVDAILNQLPNDVLCVYVAIGQKLSTVAQVVSALDASGALEHTVVVTAEASAPAALQYIAPYAGCAMAEEFMYSGRDTLIVYDDLTKHAWAYRQLSLLLRRPPGREAYPGDVFYLHARLLERAGQLDDERGGGSMTALPIVETQLGDLAAYIPTNIISITDGQIFLETELFHSGIRPAVNAGLSVSRVGGAAQSRAMQQVAGQIRLDMAQYRELQAFSQFGTDLDATTQTALGRGARLVELIKQSQHTFLAPQDQIVVFYAATHGYLNDIAIEDVQEYEALLVQYLTRERQSVRNAVAFEGRMSPQVEQALDMALNDFRQSVWNSRG
ncbi:MAG: F0F1 ATP synthase subunit alpha [Anaerolineae bacterium]